MNDEDDDDVAGKQQQRWQHQASEEESMPLDSLPVAAATHDLASYTFPNVSTTIPVALEATQRKIHLFPESQQMAQHVHARLAHVYSLLLGDQKSPFDAEVTRFCGILDQFQRYLRTPVTEISVGRFARSRRVRDLNHVFHSDIDRLLDILHVSETDPVRDWKSRFEEEFKARLGKEDYVSSCVAGSERADHADAVTIVRFGVESLHGATDSSASLESERSNQAQENVVGSGDDDVENPAIHLVQLSSPFDADSRSCPENMLEATSNLLDAFPWYLPLYEVTFDETTDCIGEGAFGAVYKAVWLDHPVVVKYMGYEADDGTVSTELFQHEVRIWYQLWHPHIVQLYGACHIGKRYFVCEYAPNGSLTEYLLRHGKDDDRFLWEKLHEAALGLQYLHYRSIVHNDLKCDNVLVGADAKAKLIDFGLSSIPDKAEIMVNVRTMGAVHWKSPEYLAGDRPTFASDIYSFAMCILEAVAGDFPWGRKMNPSLVKCQRSSRRNENTQKRRRYCIVV